MTVGYGKVFCSLLMQYRYNTRKLLPKTPAIYRLQERKRNRWRDVYVGQSINVNQRWNARGERAHQHLKRWQGDHNAHRLLLEHCWPCNLDYREALAIQRLKPTLNKLRPAASKHWSPMVLLEDLTRATPWAIALATLGVALSNAG